MVSVGVLQAFLAVPGAVRQRDATECRQASWSAARSHERRPSSRRTGASWVGAPTQGSRGRAKELLGVCYFLATGPKAIGLAKL
jgi:hypothetical protein